MKVDKQGDWGILPNKQKRIRCTPMHCLQICEKQQIDNKKRKGKAIMKKRYFDNPNENVAFEMSPIHSIRSTDIPNTSRGI